MDLTDELSRSIGGVQALAAMLRRVRTDRDLTQGQLAKRIRYPAAYVVALETARRRAPTLLTASLLAYACEVSVSLFVVSFALPAGEPLPWPRERRPLADPAQVRLGGPRALGASLREARFALNWSIADLSVRSGLSRSTIGSLERGVVAAPALLTVTRLGRALAHTTPRQIEHASQLAQSYAGEIPAPKLRRVGAMPDRHEPPAVPRE